MSLRSLRGAPLALAAVGLAACGGSAPPAAVEEPPPAPAALADAVADIAHLRVRLIGVSRAGEGALDVHFALTCAAAAPGPVAVADLLASAPSDLGSVADVFAVDEATGKRYFVVRDASRRPVGSRDLAPLAPGESRTFWTRVGAPPGEPRVSVHVPRTRPFSGVSIAATPAGGGPPEEPARQTGRM